MTKKPNFYLLILLVTMLLIPLNIKAATKENFQTVKLKNGLTVMYKVMKKEPMVSMYTVLPIGMNREKEKGIAHLLEHLVFRGGSGYTFSDIADVTNRQGGYFNGFTSFFATSYNYVVPKENFKAAFKVFNGSIWKTDLSEPVVTLERKIVLHELDMDYSSRYQYYPIYRYFFPELSYSKQTVEAISASDLKEFHETYYQPDNATYIIAGDFDPQPVLQQLESISNGYGRMNSPQSALSEFSMPHQDVIETRNLYPFQFQVLMTYEFSKMSVKERLVLKLLDFIYGSNSKIDYEKNEYKLYNTITRTVGTKDYFGLYYLERNKPFNDQAVNDEKANMKKFFREFKKIDFKNELKRFVQFIELEKIQSQESPENAVEYEVQRLTNPDNISADSIEILKKLTNKDLVQLLDKYFNQPPTAWVLVKTSKTGGI